MKKKSSLSRIFPILLFLAGTILFISAISFKDHYDYDTDLLTSNFHKERRDALRNLMPDSSVAIFFSNPVFPRSSDMEYDFHQDPNMYYFTGLREPNAVLILFKENQKIDTLSTNEILFLQDRDPKKEAWTGRILGADAAKEKLGINAVRVDAKFSQLKIDWKKFKKVLFYPLTTAAINDYQNPNDLSDMITKFQSWTKKNSNNDTTQLENYIASLRGIKEPAELVLMRKAIQISGESHIELMKALLPDMTEYQAQAIVEYGFKMRGAEAVGYSSICGAGENSCILHYTTNRKPFESNNLIVVDAGAEYHGYSADITRTLPVNGKFSPEEKAIYDIVLEAQEAGIQKCLAGNDFYAPGVAAKLIISKRLKDLGIIKDESEYTKYFFHGTSHHLGLDVHDVGSKGNLEAGMVITVEPGIYIPEGSPCDPKWWNIGVRIEDDILITDFQPEVLSGFIPKTTIDIEKTMAEKSFLNVNSAEK
jgi:Xaa-Pro aminopeptidase